MPTLDSSPGRYAGSMGVPELGMHPIPVDKPDELSMTGCRPGAAEDADVPTQPSAWYPSMPMQVQRKEVATCYEWMRCSNGDGTEILHRAWFANGISHDLDHFATRRYS